ncbi:MAG: hypothetical protein ACQGVK_23195 [Myxococcota bacterium]
MSSGSSWLSQSFEVEMPHMAPGEKLCEVEFLKWIAAYQWRASAVALGTQPRDITNQKGDRLYGSVIDFELDFGPGSGPDHLCEGAQVHVRNRIHFYANRFAEGLFVFGDREIPEEALSAIKTRSDLAASGLPWACMTNAFIARGGANTQLAVHAPAGIEDAAIEPMKRAPDGMSIHQEAQSTGHLQEFDGPPGRRLRLLTREPVRYKILREADLNGASLVYFARYLAMANYGERHLLGDHLELPLSADLVGCLSTEHRKIVYFGNAPPSDTVEISTEVRLLLPEDFAAPAEKVRWRTPLKLVFRHDLRRASDKVLMASTLVRKALNIPPDKKAILREADRFLAQLAGQEQP